MRILVTRLSALGDVALLVPVLRRFTEQFPEHKLMVLSRGHMQALFEPLNVSFYTADVYGKHKGVKGLWQLYRELKSSFNPDLVLDVHQVMRTHLLLNFFKLNRTSTFAISKGRKAKKALTVKQNKRFKPLKHTAQRYVDVFKKAGFDLQFEVRNPPIMEYKSKVAEDFLKSEVLLEEKAIAIAPFAQHKGKMWPAEKMKETIEQLADKGFQILLFGGPQDADELSVWAYELPNTLNVAGKFDLTTELAILSKVKLMLAMDSSNMHFAALVGTPVVSIWGATHPFAGFAPLGDAHSIIQIAQSDLACRPCSVYGSKPCWRGDYACLERISSESVTSKVEQQYLSNKQV